MLLTAKMNLEITTASDIRALLLNPEFESFASLPKFLRQLLRKNQPEIFFELLDSYLGTAADVYTNSIGAFRNSKISEFFQKEDFLLGFCQSPRRLQFFLDVFCEYQVDINLRESFEHLRCFQLPALSKQMLLTAFADYRRTFQDQPTVVTELAEKYQYLRLFPLGEEKFRAGTQSPALAWTQLTAVSSTMFWSALDAFFDNLEKTAAEPLSSDMLREAFTAALLDGLSGFFASPIQLEDAPVLLSDTEKISAYMRQWTRIRNSERFPESAQTMSYASADFLKKLCCAKITPAAFQCLFAMSFDLGLVDVSDFQQSLSVSTKSTPLAPVAKSALLYSAVPGFSTAFEQLQTPLLNATREEFAAMLQIFDEKLRIAAEILSNKTSERVFLVDDRTLNTIRRHITDFDADSATRLLTSCVLTEALQFEFERLTRFEQLGFNSEAGSLAAALSAHFRVFLSDQYAPELSEAGRCFFLPLHGKFSLQTFFKHTDHAQKSQSKNDFVFQAADDLLRSAATRDQYLQELQQKSHVLLKLQVMVPFQEALELLSSIPVLKALTAGLLTNLDDDMSSQQLQQLIGLSRNNTASRSCSRL